jgi:hypothetical protein
MNDTNHQFNKSKSLIESIREINAKYHTPRIQTTPMVTASLLALRIYLILMLLILLYKFISLTIK